MLKKKFFLLIIITFITLFIKNITIFSLTITSTGNKLSSLSLTTKVKTGSDGKTYYCSEFYKPAPDGGQNCIIDTTWNQYSDDAIAIGTIIASSQKYIDKEMEINAYLANNGYKYYCNESCVGSGNKNVWREGFNKTGAWTGTNYYLSIKDQGNCNGNCSSGTGWIQNYLNSLPATINQYKLLKNILLSLGDITYKDDTYNFHATVSNSSTYGYTIDITGSNTSCTTSNKDKNGFDVSCSYSGNSTSFNVTVAVTSSLSFQTSIRYDCGSDYQKLFINETKTITPADSKIKTITSLKQECEANIKGASKNKKIEWYEHYKSLGKDWRKILDFNNSKCEAKNKTGPYLSNACVSSSVAYTDSSHNSFFTDNDISDYTEDFSFGNVKAYCVTEFDLDSTILKTGEFNKAGRIVFGAEKTTDGKILGYSILKKRCYTTATTNTSAPQSLSDFSYDQYIKNIKIRVFDYNNNTSNDYILTPLGDRNQTCSLKDSWLDCRYLVKYSRENYLSLINGKVLNNCSTNNSCKKVNGLVLRFNYVKKDNEQKIGIIPFIEKGDKYKDLAFEAENICNYELSEELIKNGKLNLEFRIIDTKNPFPGENGIGRKIGKNWCEDASKFCTSENTDLSKNLKIKKYILEANDSMNKYPEKGLKYEPIILTPKIITSIREYNNKHSYDEYLLKELTNNSMIYKVQTLQRQDGTKKFANNFFYEINDKYNNFIKKLR